MTTVTSTARAGSKVRYHSLLVILQIIHWQDVAPDSLPPPETQVSVASVVSRPLVRDREAERDSAIR